MNNNQGINKRATVSRLAWKTTTAGVLTVALVSVGALAANADTLPTGPSATGQTGLRPNATRVTFPLSDHVQASVDVATGNLNLSGQLLSLPGVNASSPLTLSYNSLASVAGDNFMGSADSPRWTYGIAGAGSLALQSNGTTVDYTSTDGSVWPFTLSGSVYTSPAGLKAVLTKTGTGWTLAYLDASETVTFNSVGTPLSVADRNGNTTSINTSTGTITSSAGSTDARTAYLSFDPSYKDEHIDQKLSGSVTREWLVSQNSSGQIQGWSNPDGADTFANYNSAGLLSQFFNEGSFETDITYDSSGRVTQISQSDADDSSVPTSTTRFSYVSSTQTQVAGPDTSTSSPVSSVPHTTYTIDSSTELVTQATDAMGRVRAKTYNANLDTLTATTGSGSSSSTTTNTYGANSGDSLTNSATQSGAASSAAYANTGSSQYLPSSTTDDAGNTSTYTYNGAGNQLTSETAAVAAAATVTYNSDGTVATATLPGNGTNATTYAYNSLHELTSVTPPTGTSLGVKNFTYDSYGRLHTETDGAGHTTTYTYDGEDRLLTTSFSDSTPTVTNTYDVAGNLTKQVSGGGTITNTYDAFSHLLTTANTAGGGTITYTYDKAGNQVSLDDGEGTVTDTYDASNVLTSMTYPKGSGTAVTNFATDANGRRTDEWLATNTGNTSWAGWVHTSYDASGRVSEVKAEKGPASTASTVMDVDYCYNTGGSGTSCGTTSANDRSKLQWTYDAVLGQTTHYTYDGSGRLTGVAQSGGSAGNNTYAYSYNANGDRTGVTVTGTNPSTQTLTYNAADQITTTGYTYDAAGNLTASPGKTFTYNAAEQMTGSTVSGTSYTYAYAGASQSALLSVTGGTRNYTYAYGRADSVGNPTLLAYGGAGTTYLDPDPVTGQATLWHTSYGVALLYVYDGIGNPAASLADYDGAALSISYDPFGLPTIASSSTAVAIDQNPYLFKGGIQEHGTGWVKFGQRWYNPTTGSWTQQDTLDAPLDPANANRYAYAGDDPINNIDPSGRDSSLETAANILCGLSFLPTGVIDFVLEAGTGFGVGFVCAFVLAYELDPTLYATHPEELVANAGGY